MPTIENYNGYPAIIINGKPYPPMMATIRTNNRTHMEIDKEYYRKLGKSGIKLFFLICDTNWLKPEAMNMFCEEAEALLDVVPDAYIFPRIGLHPPNWWMERNPDETVKYNNGSRPSVHLYTESYETDLPAHYSLCSEKWMHDAGIALRETWEMILNLPYADRIIGCFLAAGGTSEWYYMLPVEDLEKGIYADFSKSFKTYFGKFLKEKYKSEENLREQWKTPDATFDNPIIPGIESRYYTHQVDYDAMNPPYIMYANAPNPPSPSNGTNIGSFVDIDNHQDIFDFYQAWHLGTAVSTIYFANIIKEITPDKLVGSFYGSYGCTDFFGTGTCGSVLKILDSAKVDFLAAPGAYENRQPGGFTGQREMADSFRIRNTMFIVEEDTRTHFETPFFQARYDMYDMDDSIAVLKRDFARNICDDLQGWWFDQIIGGKRYKDEKIYELFERQQEIAKYSYKLNRVKDNEIAFIYDEESIHTISQKSTCDTVEYMRNFEIARIGAPVDQYFHNDMSNPLMPDYKLYVFFNTYFLDNKERTEIINKIKKSGAVALWMYAPGIINPDSDKKFDVAHITKLIGINTSMVNEQYNAKFKINGEEHQIINELDKGKIYGNLDRERITNIGQRDHDDVYLYPVFYADDNDAIVLAKFLCNKLPALTIKKMDGWTSVFCGTKTIRADLLKSVARYAGCHIISENDDCIYANKNFVSIHAKTSGHKILKFSNVCSPYEVYERKFYGKDISSIEFDILRGQTLMFSLNGIC